MVTVEMPPAFSSTSTASTPARASSSSLTAETQWPQVIPETFTVVVVGEVVLMAGSSCCAGGSRCWMGVVLAQQPADGVSGFLDFGIDGFGAGGRIRLGGGAHHAMADMLLHQAQADR